MKEEEGEMHKQFELSGMKIPLCFGLITSCGFLIVNRPTHLVDLFIWLQTIVPPTYRSAVGFELPVKDQQHWLSKMNLNRWTLDVVIIILIVMVKKMVSINCH